MAYVQRSWLAWASVSLLAVLCAVLAALQYVWVGEIADAERTRLRDQLQVRLTAVSRAFNEDLSSAVQTLRPSDDEIEQLGRERAYAAQYLKWRSSHDPLFRRIGL